MTDNQQPLYMLWQDLDSKKTPEQVLQDAAAHFSHKYGQVPTLALVPLNFPDLNGKTPEGLTIERHKNVRPSYVWLQVPDVTPQTEADQAAEQVQE